MSIFRTTLKVLTGVAVVGVAGAALWKVGEAACEVFGKRAAEAAEARAHYQPEWPSRNRISLRDGFPLKRD